MENLNFRTSSPGKASLTYIPSSKAPLNEENSEPLKKHQKKVTSQKVLVNARFSKSPQIETSLNSVHLPEPFENLKKNINIIENKKLDKKKNKVAIKLLNQLEFKQQALKTDKNSNNILLNVNNKEIITEISKTTFVTTFKNIMSLGEGNEAILSLNKKTAEQIIFINKVSNKRKREEVKILYIPSEVKGNGGLSQYKEIHKIGNNTIKGFKKIKNIKHNHILNLEKLCLKNLHEKLPIDTCLDRKGSKHLGIQDAFKFGKTDIKNEPSYVIGTAYQLDGAHLICKGAIVLPLLYQLAFGLKIFHDQNLFEHDIKPHNVFVSKDKTFPLTVKAVLADLNLIPEEKLRDYYKKNIIDIQNPFGIHTPMFQPKTDIQKILQYNQDINKNKTNPEEFEKIFQQILNLRRKNMISLLGQTFFYVLTNNPLNEWPQEFISYKDEETIELFKTAVHTKVKLHQYKIKLDESTDLTENEKTFCQEITNLILDMTDLDHEKRLSADQVLNTLLSMLEKRSPSIYEVIVKNRWTNSYADWEK